MSRRPERLADLLPGVVADLAARHNTTNGAEVTTGHMDDLLDHLQQCVNEYIFRINGPAEWRVGSEVYDVDHAAYPSDGAAFLVRKSDGARFWVGADVSVHKLDEAGAA